VEREKRLWGARFDSCLFPSPQMEERFRVRGKAIGSPLKVINRSYEISAK
jgi:hypothetical protein